MKPIQYFISYYMLTNAGAGRPHKLLQARVPTSLELIVEYTRLPYTRYPRSSPPSPLLSPCHLPRSLDAYRFFAHINCMPHRLASYKLCGPGLQHTEGISEQLCASYRCCNLRSSWMYTKAVLNHNSSFFCTSRHPNISLLELFHSTHTIHSDASLYINA